MAQRYGTNCTVDGSYPKKHKFSIYIFLHMEQRQDVPRTKLG